MSLYFRRYVFIIRFRRFNRPYRFCIIIRTFNNPSLRLIQADTLLYLQNTREAYDLVFLDPPFTKNYVPECLNELLKNNLLSKDALVYIEAPHAIEANPSQWQPLKLKQAGQVFYGLFKEV